VLAIMLVLARISLSAAAGASQLGERLERNPQTGLASLNSRRGRHPSILSLSGPMEHNALRRSRAPEVAGSLSNGRWLASSLSNGSFAEQRQL
jgi:hypothetical protein